MARRIHLRAAGDMGKEYSARTFCGMQTRQSHNRLLRRYEVTEYATLVTCKRCVEKMAMARGEKMKRKEDAV